MLYLGSKSQSLNIHWSRCYNCQGLTGADGYHSAPRIRSCLSEMKLLCADKVREYERWSSETTLESTGRKAAVVHTELESVQESLRLKGMFSLCHSWTRGILFGNCNRNKCFLVGWI